MILQYTNLKPFKTSYMLEIPVQIFVLLMSLLVGVISFTVGILLKTLNQNTKAINSINITLAKYEEQDKRDKEEEAYIKGKLATHGKRLEDHEKRIYKLEK